MITEILTSLGITGSAALAAAKGLLNLRDRIKDVESAQQNDEKLVLVKLDAISEKIDLRCDALEQRVDRIERKVLNGEYHRP